ncbi:MAG: hypothetical protein JOZ07_05530 [Solirubrobacterales bacterium]|nr:hypothetical protein [Solirubrobacterales bacterium]
MSAVSDSQSGWTPYDELAGPELDAELWQPADFGTGPRIEPHARTTVKDGTVTIDVPRFENTDTENQGLDNTKHLLFSTRGFPVPAERTAGFSAELRSEVRDQAGDYRLGFASFTLADMATHRVFAILSTGERIFAEEERLPGHAESSPFTRIIEDPFFFSRGGTRPDGGFRRCTIEIDRSRGQVDFRVDDEILHVVAGLSDVPDEVHMALGIFTLLPIGEGEGSARGQGGRASWRNIAYTSHPDAPR